MEKLRAMPPERLHSRKLRLVRRRRSSRENVAIEDHGRVEVGRGQRHLMQLLQHEIAAHKRTRGEARLLRGWCRA
jgi:hypothetical protein